MLKSFKEIFHRHRWETTHTNKWQIPTRQVCNCGLSRQVEIDRSRRLTYRWVYSDGRKSKRYALGEGMNDENIKT